MGPSWSRAGDQDDMHASFVVANTGIWHFYAGTYDSILGTRCWYVDGALSGKDTGLGAYNMSTNTHLAIGGKDQPLGNNFTGYITGEIYGVLFYNTALSAGQVNYFITPPPIPAPSFSVKPAVTTGPNGKQFVMTWTYGTLLQATNVLGPWTTNPATSPYTVIVSNAPQKFFKLQQ
jgi:hypothetical protein